MSNPLLLPLFQTRGLNGERCRSPSLVLLESLHPLPHYLHLPHHLLLHLLHHRPPPAVTRPACAQFVFTPLNNPDSCINLSCFTSCLIDMRSQANTSDCLEQCDPMQWAWTKPHLSQWEERGQAQGTNGLKVLWVFLFVKLLFEWTFFICLMKN